MNEASSFRRTRRGRCAVSWDASGASAPGGIVEHVFATLADGKGGWLVTANLDFLRRYVRDAQVRTLYDAADLRWPTARPWCGRRGCRAMPCLNGSPDRRCCGFWPKGPRGTDVRSICLADADRQRGAARVLG